MGLLIRPYLLTRTRHGIQTQTASITIKSNTASDNVLQKINFSDTPYHYLSTQAAIKTSRIKTEMGTCSLKCVHVCMYVISPQYYIKALSGIIWQKGCSISISDHVCDWLLVFS